jgi:carbon-monoxide dehydrogenase small subunit
MKKSIQLAVNGQSVTADVEPRMQLADFLRDQLFLTGTHLGCEHGVCGACTVELDGAPARSCITYAVSCNGATVRTIEGFDDDAVMAELREAFSAEHALQCGYCTPGMLVTARDIVTRIPNADLNRIRKELAGNLCRCTGYVGIVRAIQRVLVARGGKAEASAQAVHGSTPLPLPPDRASLVRGFGYDCSSARTDL